MAQLLLLEITLLTIGLISNYLTWGPMTSKEMIILFGPLIDAKDRDQVNSDSFLEKRRKQSLASERTRLVALIVITSIGLTFFSPGQYLSRLRQNMTFQASAVIIVLIIIIWCFYLGPKYFSIEDSGRFKFFSASSFHKYIKPYIAWLPYGIVVWMGLGLVSFYLVIYNVSSDFQTAEQALSRMNQLLINVNSIGELQYAAFNLVALGRFLALVTQKYWIATLLAFLYVLVEQRSNMRFTVRASSVELMKIAIWVALISIASVSLVYMPSRYGEIQIALLAKSEQMVTPQTNDDELAQIIALQQYIEEHGIEWLMLRVIRGQGNIVTLFIVGLSLLLWKAFFKDIPLTDFLRVLLPHAVLKFIDEFAGNLEFDLKMNRPDKGET